MYACTRTFRERTLVGRLPFRENGSDENAHAAPRRILAADHAESEALPPRTLLVEHRPQAPLRTGKLEHARAWRDRRGPRGLGREGRVNGF